MSATEARRWPAHWDVAPLGAITTKVTSGSRDWKPYYERGTGVFILSQNVRMRRLHIPEPFHVDPPADDPARQRSAVQQDDLLINVVGAVGTVARVTRPLDEHYVCQSVALVVRRFQLLVGGLSCTWRPRTAGRSTSARRRTDSGGLISVSTTSRPCPSRCRR